MKFSLFPIAALAAATSCSCVVSATASRKRKIAKKGGSLSVSYEAIGPPTDNKWTHEQSCPEDGTKCPPGDYCCSADDCAIPVGLTHAVCRNGGGADGNTAGDCLPGNFWVSLYQCQSGQPGSFCGVTDDCVVQTDLDPPHAVCRGPTGDQKCQR